MTAITKWLGKGGRSYGSALLLPVCAAAFTACGGLLDVDNPNDVPIAEIESPASNASLANGLHALVGHGIVGINIIYATATDEIQWFGSRDGFRELDQGKISNAYNEFLDGFTRNYAPGNIVEARWQGDEAIRIMEAQQADGSLRSPLALGQVYLYTAMAYVNIANSFDDWVLAQVRGETVAPVGTANMHTLYTTAIGYLTKGLTVANGLAAGADKTNLLTQLNAMLAQAHFSRAIWDRVHPCCSGNGVVSMATSATSINAAVTAALAALALMGSTDYEYRFTFNVNTGQDAQGSWIGSRQEVRLAPTYVQPSATSPTWNNVTVLNDLISGAPSPVVHFIQGRFKTEGTYKGYTMFSRREMLLILAEAALAGAAGTGNTFQGHINTLRGMDALPAFTSGGAGMPTDVAMLHHSRQTNLFMMTRRLSDMYRFGATSPEWSPGAQILLSPRFFPIPATECLSNTTIGAAACST